MKMQGYLLGEVDHPRVRVSEPFQRGMGIRSPKLSGTPRATLSFSPSTQPPSLSVCLSLSHVLPVSCLHIC